MAVIGETIPRCRPCRRGRRGHNLVDQGECWDTLRVARGNLAAYVREGISLCTAPGFLDNRFPYAARLKAWSCQAVRMAAGLRWPSFSISHSAL